MSQRGILCRETVSWPENRDQDGQGQEHQRSHSALTIPEASSKSTDGVFDTHNLIRDRDSSYGPIFVERLRSMGIRDRPTAPRSPWQNAYAERLIGSIRRECLDHIVVFGEGHLRRILRAYAHYYNSVRTHISLGKDTPDRRPVQRVGCVESMPFLNGLHHRYVRI